MPISNPYPERAIASFVLVGAMGVALLLIGTPADEKARSGSVIAEQTPPEEPPARSNGRNQYPAVPDRISPSVVVADHQLSGPVFSEAAIGRMVETPVTAASAAPGRSQGPSAADPAPTPEPATPEGDRDPLLDVGLDVEIRPCATSILLLNDLLCR